MDITSLLLVIYVTVALIIAALFFFARDLIARRGASKDQELEQAEKGLDLGALLPRTDAAAAAAKDESWLGRLAVESGSDFTAETSLLAAVAAGLALGGALFLWRDDWLAGAAGAVAGVLAIGGFLFYRRFRRYRSIREQLPDVMELVARAVRAGESLDQAIALAGNSGLRPVAAEFRYCASQMRMGLSLESAVRGMVGRVPLPETRILAMALIVQRRRGGSLPTTLERLARVFRDRSNFFRQFQAATALGRGSAALIALVGLGLDAFVILGHSEYAQSLLTTNAGRIMLAIALMLQVVGVTWAAWLFRSHY
jgi:tight adherence protein B